MRAHIDKFLHSVTWLIYIPLFAILGLSLSAVALAVIFIQPNIIMDEALEISESLRMSDSLEVTLNP